MSCRQQVEKIDNRCAKKNGQGHLCWLSRGLEISVCFPLVTNYFPSTSLQLSIYVCRQQAFKEAKLLYNLKYLPFCLLETVWWNHDFHECFKDRHLFLTLSVGLMVRLQKSYFHNYIFSTIVTLFCVCEGFHV